MNLYHTKDLKLASFFVFNGIPLLYKCLHGETTYYYFDRDRKNLEIFERKIAKITYQLKKEPVI